MGVKYQKLVWDSDFFQYNVCRILNDKLSNDDLVEISAIMKENEYKLAYYSSINKLEFETNGTLEIKLVDKKTTFVKKTSSELDAHPMIESYKSRIPTAKIINLAIQSGVYSRFNVDENIGNDKYKELYRIWITKSISREIANEVIVYKEKDDDLAGYLTIGEKSNRADLGMGAVDSTFRGKGIGRILFENAEKWAFDNGYNEIQIVTQGDNIPACSLYESLGYNVDSMEYFYHIWRK
jgi:dTDP-4-amino-4,6-dideoxy-D-galactose acyltransferase